MTYKVTWRDRLAYTIANWAMETIATKEYRAFISVLIAVGKKHLVEELEKEDA